ncbi:hypothetical protein [Absidia glauca]|uniref:BHLH domain-containing protein n=1 Tax=Absidia glauca TaxID=4829 RepID=A0A168M5U8_ABSGL|nr:hypothetical protein [Absidia glauca]
MDPEYDPSHKTSSITSTTSWDTVPSLTASSICDIDSPSLHDQTTFDDYTFTGDGAGLSIPFEDLAPGGPSNQKSFDQFLDNFFIDGKAPVFLQQSHDMTINTQVEEAPRRPATQPKATEPLPPPRDLLTEDEKRANHIASEQKRRNAIRTGFKEMTDIIPTLKNINNSKSTILFKAVEYIRHLDKRNRGLRDKLNALQVRLEVEGRMGGLMRHHARRHNSTSNSHYYNNDSHPSKKSRSSLPPEAVAALLAHKNQQKQLERLQEQLRYQQELLARHNIPTMDGSYISIPTDRSSRHSIVNNPHPSTWPSFSIPADDDFGRS